MHLTTGTIFKEYTTVNGTILRTDSFFALGSWWSRWSRLSWCTICSWLTIRSWWPFRTGLTWCTIATWSSWWSRWSLRSWFSCSIIYLELFPQDEHVKYFLWDMQVNINMYKYLLKCAFT